MSKHALPSRNYRRRCADDPGGCKFTLWNSNHGTVRRGRACKRALGHDGHRTGNFPIDVTDICSAKICHAEVSDLIIDVSDVNV
jgi:hypothetical protein